MGVKIVETSNRYDCIFIGSGIGSLTAASLLAQYKNKKILIIEKHFKAGGFTHSFRRLQKFFWDVGIHYIGNLEEESFTRKIFDTITGGKVHWQKMEEPFEKFVYPDFTFSVYGNREKYISDLVNLFPEEKSSIEKYFLDVKKVAGHFGKKMMLKLAPPFLDSFFNLFESKDSIQTTKDYMDSHFKDPKLKSLLVSQWGDYGLPPSLSSFAIHSLIVEHYINGGYYPVGGAGKIVESIEPIILEKGGEILLSHEVTEILCKDGKVTGVRVKNLHTREEDNTKEFYSDIVMSNAGAYNTYIKLIPDSVEITFREDLIKFMKDSPNLACVTLYLGFSEDPRKLGFKGENYWIFSNYDHDKNFSNRKSWVESKDVTGLYLSFPSLKDPESKTHTAEIIAFCDYESFEKWKDQPWKKRDEDYQKLKKEISESLLNYVEKIFPGFNDLIEFSELSTPITNEHFTGHFQGNIYGIPCVPERFHKGKSPWCNIKTPIEGLYLVGADASSPGVTGAMMGGMAAALTQMDGLNIFRILAGKKK